MTKRPLKRKASAPRKAAKPAANPKQDEAALPRELAETQRQLAESLAQQTVTSDVLKVISRSAFDLQTVLDTLVESATRLCESDQAWLFQRDGDLYRFAASFGTNPETHARLRAFFLPLEVRGERGSITGRAILEGRTVHVPDVLQDPEYTWGKAQEIGGYRAALGVPLLREGEVVGVIFVNKSMSGPFTDKQIELVTTFADQAVIAIENTRLLNELHQRTDDLSEALEQQTAISEILRVISSSPGDVQPVLDTVAENAARICEAQFVDIVLSDGGTMHVGAVFGELGRPIGQTLTLDRTTVMGRSICDGAVVHVADLQAMSDEFPAGQKLAMEYGHRSILAVPLLREGRVLGTILLRRTEVRPFTDKLISLLKTFADQAAIAIENTRLLNELRQRTDDLSEALEQQTATSEVLKVISSSPGDLDPVFDAILQSSAQICEANFGVLNLIENGIARNAAGYNLPAGFEPIWANATFSPHPESGMGQLLRTKRTVHIEDIRKGQAYLDRDANVRGLSDGGGARTLVLVPMLKESELVGSIGIFRQEVRPFTSKQIELLQNFAAQAVIAIENTRLLKELRQRTDDLGEALEQQTATSEVLEIISNSPGELSPVFDAMLANAIRVCDARFGNLFLREGNLCRAVAVAGEQSYIDQWRHTPTLDITEDPALPLARVAATGEVLHITDLKEDAAFKDRVPRVVALVETAGARAFVVVPMLKDGQLIGAIAMYRQVNVPFTEKQIELVSNFAAQAVIAIENTRLLSELRESLQQQTATADVLKVISRSVSDLQPVLDTIVQTAARLCNAEYSLAFRLRDGFYEMVAANNAEDELVQYSVKNPLRPGRGSLIGRTALTGKTVHLPDCLSDPEYTVLEYQKVGKYRTTLGVPLLRDGVTIGVLAMMRAKVSPFSDREIELVTTFADQAVIAIENTRLFNEVQARTEDLAESLQQQTATADVLKVISRSAFDLKIVLQTLVESAARLCDAEKATITRQIDGVFYRAESFGFSEQFMDAVRSVPVVPDRGSVTARALLEGKVIHIEDVQNDKDYNFTDALRLSDIRTLLGVPMLRDGKAIGVLALTRPEVRPFTDKQIELVSTFADQAAIAIENVRLFEDVQARTRELAASLEDLRAAQDRLVQTEKLASLGQLTAGIAHEIKNPLNFVNNFSAVSVELIDELREVLESPKQDDTRRAEIQELLTLLQGNLDKVVQHGKRADSIVKNMLLHAREGSGEHRPVDVNSVVEESLNLAYHGARAERQDFNITLERSFDPQAGQVDMFPQEISRVLLNLISNGFYAATKRKAQVGNGFEPTLAAATRSLGGHVEITIRDNGIGIPPEIKEKIFNPFFTTKPAGEGTGLGLSLSHDIVVKQHAGTLEVDTSPGEFTEFKIVLPRAAATLGKSLAKSRGAV